MSILNLTLDGAGETLVTRRFSVQEGISNLFTVSIWAGSRNDSLDLDSIVGKSATFRIVAGYKWALLGGARYWTGICSYMEQVQAESTGLSTYFLRIVPKLWLLTQRRGNRIYQHLSIPDIVDALLGEWGIEKVWRENASHRAFAAVAPRSTFPARAPDISDNGDCGTSCTTVARSRNPGIDRGARPEWRCGIARYR